MNVVHMKVSTTKNKYGLLLVALLSFILLSPLTNNSFIGKASFLVLFVFTILGVTRSISSSHHTRLFLAAIGLVSVIFNLTGRGYFDLEMASKLTSLMFFGYAIKLFMADIFFRCEASIDSLFGSVCIYLLIGTVFATIYLIIQMFDATAFVYSSTGLPLQHPFDDYYFSFVTLTTTGFGDIVPNSQVARSFVTIEAITGLFYLAILVAHLATLVRPPEAKS